MVPVLMRIRGDRPLATKHTHCSGSPGLLGGYDRCHDCHIMSTITMNDVTILCGVGVVMVAVAIPPGSATNVMFKPIRP